MSNERIVKLDQYEFGAVISIVNEKRNNLLKQQKDTKFITEILEKLINAPTKRKNQLKVKRENYER